jgi:hypothetical protein
MVAVLDVGKLIVPGKYMPTARSRAKNLMNNRSNQLF